MCYLSVKRNEEVNPFMVSVNALFVFICALVLENCEIKE